MKGMGMEGIKSPVIASVAKQSRALAKMQRFFLDYFGLRPRNDVPLLPLRDFVASHISFSILNSQFSILNFQFSIVEVFNY
jgi:hypothetical protein